MMTFAYPSHFQFLITDAPFKIDFGQKYQFKGTVSRDFLLLVFFINQFPLTPSVYLEGRFEFFRKFAEIFATQG